MISWVKLTDWFYVDCVSSVDAMPWIITFFKIYYQKLSFDWWKDIVEFVGRLAAKLAYPVIYDLRYALPFLYTCLQYLSYLDWGQLLPKNRFGWSSKYLVAVIPLKLNSPYVDSSIILLEKAGALSIHFQKQVFGLTKDKTDWLSLFFNDLFIKSNYFSQRFIQYQ